MPTGWTLRYQGMGVYDTSKAYTVLYQGVPQFGISVDYPHPKRTALTIEHHLEYIWIRSREIGHAV